MEKATIELTRNKHISGYTSTAELYDNSPQVLNALVEWSKGKNVSIYRHKLFRAEENISDEVYAYFHFGQKVSKEQYESLKNHSQSSYVIHYCELVEYLDIYYQEK